ncbi:hypothetical protein [Streptomyces decoyicus]|nr:hypothetical protein [Streptomyces decoyicus]
MQKMTMDHVRITKVDSPPARQWGNGAAQTAVFSFSGLTIA